MRRALLSAAVVGAAAFVAPFVHAVEGGAVDRATTHAVSIATGGPLAPTVQCSGTLVSPNVVLTVRHCVARIPADRPNCEGVFPAPSGVPSDFWVDATPWAVPSTTWKNVSSWVLPERTEVCGNDVALLVLADSFLASQAVPARPVTTEAAFRAAVASRQLGIAGFGSSSSAGNDPGTRRSRFGIPIQCVPGDQSFACGGALEYIDVREFTGGAGPCTGDSGAGAILTSDHETIFGVMSRGSRASAACAEGVFERTDVWGWLIAKTVLEATREGTTPPAWVRDAFPDAAKEGQFCRVATDCGPAAECVSLDGRRSFTCATRCSSDEACAAGAHCESNVCAPGAPSSPRESGCAVGRGVTRPRASSRASWAAACAIALLVVSSRIFAIELALLRARLRRLLGRARRKRSGDGVR